MSHPEFDPIAFQQFEHAAWERKAQGYHTFYAAISCYVVNRLLDAAQIGPSTRVLDVGSGPGYVAARAAERGAYPVGLDSSQSMVALARRLYPGLRFEVGDAQDLPFPPASFDSVVGNFVLHHLPQQARALAGFARVLAPGGLVALTVWDEPARCRLLGVFFDSVQQAGATPPSSLPTGPPMAASDVAYTDLLRGEGFDAPRVEAIAYTHRFSSPDALWDGMLGASVRTAALILEQPPEVRKRIRAAFDRLAAAYMMAEGLELPVSVKLMTGQVPLHAR